MRAATTPSTSPRLPSDRLIVGDTAGGDPPPQDDHAPVKQMTLQIPVIVLVLAFTAIPVEMRPPGQAVADLFDLRWGLADVIANVVGYIPLGLVLAVRGAVAAVAVATIVSGLGEASQVFIEGRWPSLIDIATNVIGAVIGWGINARWKILPVRIRITRRGALLAVVLALGYVSIAAQVTPREVEDAVTALATTLSVARLPVNARGSTSPGRLEAHWTFDGGEEDLALDSSGNALSGVLANRPAFVAGIDGRAVRLNGVNQYVDFGDPTALRLTGSMTISAWINASAFPVDDAAIVSDHSGLGYQLDATVDRGPRTIGFKLADAWGRLMARYGRTALDTDTWYHVAGVYDARVQTLNVYLNGEPDNGCLLGTVTARQHISGVHAYVGRRGRGEGFEFAGSIDEVRIYSRALTQHEIDTQMKQTMTAQAARLRTTGVSDRALYSSSSDTACAPREASDARTSGLVVAFGLLVAVACAGLWPTPGYRIPCLVFSCAAGFLLAPLVASTLPAFYHKIIPLLTLAGGAALAVSAGSHEAGQRS